ncbi:MAG: ATP-dependent DNA helicase DinG [Pseudomonadales bacterium]|nr:ATP-dependent DNA helicase DinG [Pseudomonadales bacterium]MCP5183166.1 ATP-dependent DNA helicase DinG [Pseudomonadales bacterium]
MFELTDSLKADIQDAYSSWLSSRDFRARRGQREMVAHIARSLCDPAVRLTAVEAGTGTGKTAAYCLAAIPVAKTLGKKVILSTATVALQEQVVLRDLPDLQQHSSLRFSYTLAKGRRRYVCLKRLDDALKPADRQVEQLFEPPARGAGDTYQAMLYAFGDGSWNGEIDAWRDGIADEEWQAITTDHRGCTNRRCAYFQSCPFFKARNNLTGTDVIVANHDLVLSDLGLGGGVVLPAPEESIYVFDEAHHLPEKTQNHFSARARLKGTMTWFDQVNTTVGTMTQRFERPAELLNLVTRLAKDTADTAEGLSMLISEVAPLPFQARDDSLATYRFPLGCVPATLAAASDAALRPMRDVEAALARVEDKLTEVSQGEVDWPNRHEADDWLAVTGQLLARAEAVIAVLSDYAGAPERIDAGASAADMHARWVNLSGEDHELISTPIEPGALLREVLWNRCFGAVCTSATLTVAGRWERFLERAGLDSTAATLCIPSPFDYPNLVTFRVPAMQADPRQADAHNIEIAGMLPALLEQERSALVLFASWRQMRRVLELLPARLAGRLHVQGAASKQALLDAHRQRVDDGQPSYLLGLASFAEGLDLPDDYCRHVIIAKLPFAVPDDPVDQAAAEWAEFNGRNPFMEISVPDAAVKLVQACGRLVRHEKDHGRITLLDRRIVTQRYGALLLRSLPPYQREFDAA